MDLVTIAVIVIATALAVLVAALVPTVKQLRATLASAEVFIKNLDGSLKPLLDDEVRPLVRTMNGTMEEVEGVAKTAHEGAEKVGDLMDAVGEVGDAVRTINHIINSSIKKSIVELAAYIVGVKTGIESLVEIIKRRGQKEVH